MHLLCSTPHIYPDKVEAAFLKALNTVIKDKETVLNKAETCVAKLKNTAALEKVRDKIRAEISDIIKTVSEGSMVIVDKIKYKVENDALYSRHNELSDRLDEILTDLKQRKVDIIAVEAFIRYFSEMGGPVKKFDSFYWDKLLDTIICPWQK